MPAGIKYLHWVVHLLLLFDQRGKQVLLGGILTFNRSLIDSIYSYSSTSPHKPCGLVIKILANESLTVTYSAGEIEAKLIH